MKAANHHPLHTNHSHPFMARANTKCPFIAFHTASTQQSCPSLSDSEAGAAYLINKFTHIPAFSQNLNKPHFHPNTGKNKNTQSTFYKIYGPELVFPKASVMSNTCHGTFSAEQLPVLVEVREEQAVDEGGFSQAGLAWKDTQSFQPGGGAPSSHVIRLARPSHSPATMRVKSKPFFTDFLCTWLGRVAKPTYSLS